jgi:predicted ArsR family transcriptional regulator
VSAPADEERSGNEEIPAAVAAIAALGDPTRRTLYRYIVAQDGAVGREQAAEALGIARHVARFHLDRLHEAGLLEVEYKRPAGRGGPGAGHPTKLYRPAAAEYAVSVPERRYDIAAEVLTRAVATAMEGGKPVGQALEEAAGQTGRAIGTKARPRGARLRRGRTALVAAVDALDGCGFAPRREGDGYVLANCPFRTLAQAEPDVICRMNLALVGGLLDEIGVRTAATRLDPADGRCCVTVG